jgi:hypothetical protein
VNDGAAGMTGKIKARFVPLCLHRSPRPVAAPRMPTFDQRVERALQNLCAHEPGHFVVAQHFGTACHAHLWKSFDPGASPNAQEASSIRNDTAACAILRRKSEPATEPMLFRRGSRRGDRHAQQSQWRR